MTLIAAHPLLSLAVAWVGCLCWLVLWLYRLASSMEDSDAE